MPSSLGRRAILFTALAFLWSLGLLVAALLLPVYGPATLVQENGSRVLLVVAVPAAVTVAVWVALWHKCSRGGHLGAIAAWACIALLAAFCLLAIFSIGIYVAPAAILLALAAALTPAGAPPGPTTDGFA